MNRKKELTAENFDAVTPLPQANTPPETPQGPLEDVMVKLEVVPERVMVARV